MFLKKSALAHAILGALAFVNASAQEASKTLSPVIVTADPLRAGEDAMILAPAKVLSGDELRNKAGLSLGETLGGELGVQASGFSAATSRPVIRGLEGPRIKVLENGMGSGDLSAISNDHAVGSSMMTARQVEILRGPASLAYGSGAIGGLVNIVNDRIPTELAPRASGEAELRVGSVDRSGGLGFSAERSAGNIGLHVDGSTSDAGDYRIPGAANVDGTGDRGKLSFSSQRERNVGVGATLMQDWGRIGASLAQLDKHYGVHGKDENSAIDLSRTRFDIDSLFKSPLEGFDSLAFKFGYTNYRHTELENGTDPSVRFSNKVADARWELAHQPVNGWRGKLGVQAEDADTQAASLTGGSATVPRTRSRMMATFLVEERDFGALRINAGARYEHVSRDPDNATERKFSLGSASLGALWTFRPGYGLGTTLSLAQRAPTAEELYSNGEHHPTDSFDRGNANLKNETSRNLELSLQKTSDDLRWKTNLYRNSVANFIYGRISTGTQGLAFDRDFTQADATLQGVEAEISYRQNQPGLSGRAFFDTSRGTLDGLGNLPLQPATRVGLSLGYRQGPWLSSLSALHANAHTRIAAASVSQETATAGYTQLDASLSYVQRYGTTDLTWFLLARNLLNQDIRLSTSLLKDYVPQPGRNFIVGVRTRF